MIEKQVQITVTINVNIDEATKIGMSADGDFYLFDDAFENCTPLDEYLDTFKTNE